MDTGLAISEDIVEDTAVRPAPTVRTAIRPVAIDARPTGLGDARLSPSLHLFAYLAAICTTTGTLLYCYVVGLRSIRPAMIWIHEWTGNAAALALVVYLLRHVVRIWGLRRARPLSWWTGIVALTAWIVAIATGIWGQFVPLPRDTLLWWLHAVGSAAAVVVLGFHSVYGYRRWVGRQKGAT